MAAYFTGGGAGTDVVQAAGTDGLQTLYLMNPSYVGFTDAAAAPGGGAAAANMVFLNSAVSTLTPASFGHHHQPTPAAQHFVGIPLQSGYNLWGPDATGGNDVSPPRHGAQQQAPAAAGTSAAAVSPVLSLSSREAAPPVTVAAAAAAAVPGGTDQEKVVMRSRYLKAAQELLDEAVSVSKGAATAVKKKEDSEGGVSGGGGGAEDGGGSKSGAAAEMSMAERQELQMKKSKLLNMLDENLSPFMQICNQKLSSGSVKKCL
uniref:POX domain-containing protein n=1 Tax=Oryza barthii TaxID=65489 RepID=A0A0D3HRP5_9ORYZ